MMHYPQWQKPLNRTAIPRVAIRYSHWPFLHNNHSRERSPRDRRGVAEGLQRGCRGNCRGDCRVRLCFLRIGGKGSKLCCRELSESMAMAMAGSCGSCCCRVGNVKAVPALTTSAWPGGPCRRAVAVRLHTFTIPKFGRRGSQRGLEGGGIGGCCGVKGAFSGKGGRARSGKPPSFHVAWCGVVQVVSAGESGSGDQVDEAMASTRKLPKLQGTLFKYGSKPSQLAFKTGNYKQQVVFIGGLTDGFLATDYIEPLAKALDAEKWSLVQTLLTSSFTGFGISSLKEDATEIEQLLNYLIDQEDSEGFILVGHSTGCQDIVHYLRTGGHCTRAVRGAILQAPVSDREYRVQQPQTEAMLELAEKMIKEGKAEDLMPRDASPEAPITAYRFRSLCAFMGDDDLFSSDFTDAQLKERLGHMSRVPCQVIFSMADDYIPDHVDKVKLLNRLCDAMGGADKIAMPYGDHSLSNRVQETVRVMINFIKKGGPKGWDDPWS